MTLAQKHALAVAVTGVMVSSFLLAMTAAPSHFALTVEPADAPVEDEAGRRQELERIELKEWAARAVAAENAVDAVMQRFNQDALSETAALRALERIRERYPDTPAVAEIWEQVEFVRGGGWRAFVR